MMLRNIIRGSTKIFPSTSRSFRSSSIVYKKDDNEDDFRKKLGKDHEGDDYWSKEPDMEDPIARATRVMGNQFRDIKQRIFFWKEVKGPEWEEWEIDSTDFPTHVDILIIGGGVMGMCTAYWLQKYGGKGFQVVIVEDEPIEKYTSSMLMTSSVITQQFALEENIELSLYGTHFLRDADKFLGFDKEDAVDLEFRPHGNLILAREEDAEKLIENVRLQNSFGASTSIYTPTQLQRMFPWLNTEGIAIGTMGNEKEGSFNPYTFLKALRRKTKAMGVEYASAEVKGFVFQNVGNFVTVSNATSDLYNKLNHAIVKTEAGEKKVIQFAACIVAAGAKSGNICRLMKIGRTTGIRSVPLPVIPRQRYMCYFEAPDGPTLNCPVVNDPSGVFFRRENLTNLYMAGKIPLHEKIDPSALELDEKNLPIDEEYFQREILPSLVERVPAFKNSKLISTKTGVYDYNYFDENGVVGHHPLYTNIMFATGFGEHSFVHAPGVGRGIAEYIRNTNYKTIDQFRLSFERFLSEEEMRARVV